MASRFPSSTSRSTNLFAGYEAQRQASASPSLSQRSSTASNGYAIHPKKSDEGPRSTSAFGAYPGSNPYSYTGANGGAGANASARSGSADGALGGYRSATPNKWGQYSDAVLSELESQNEDELQGMTAKVRMLKDLTSAIGDEIRDSTALADKMNLTFENSRNKLRGTMNRMLRMAERTGVGWKAWVGFFAAVILLFCYVWLF